MTAGDSRCTAYADESQRPGRHSLTVVVLGDQTMDQRARRMLRCLLLPRESQIHFAHESDRRRRVVLSSVSHLPEAALTVTARKAPGVSGNDIRSALVTAAASAASALGADCLTLERRTAAEDTRERSTLARGRVDIAYRHADPHDEPLLWLPDAVGWCIGRGGEWPSRLPGGWRSSRRVERGD